MLRTMAVVIHPRPVRMTRQDYEREIAARVAAGMTSPGCPVEIDQLVRTAHPD
jgi:hypothetical protein